MLLLLTLDDTSSSVPILLTGNTDWPLDFPKWINSCSHRRTFTSSSIQPLQPRPFPPNPYNDCRKRRLFPGESELTTLPGHWLPDDTLSTVPLTCFFPSLLKENSGLFPRQGLSSLESFCPRFVGGSISLHQELWALREYLGVRATIAFQQLNSCPKLFQNEQY